MFFEETTLLIGITPRFALYSADMHRFFIQTFISQISELLNILADNHLALSFLLIIKLFQYILSETLEVFIPRRDSMKAGPTCSPVIIPFISFIFIYNMNKYKAVLLKIYSKVAKNVFMDYKFSCKVGGGVHNFQNYTMLTFQIFGSKLAYVNSVFEKKIGKKSRAKGVTLTNDCKPIRPRTLIFPLGSKHSTTNQRVPKARVVMGGMRWEWMGCDILPILIFLIFKYDSTF